MEGHANITPPFLFLPPSLALLLARMLSGPQPPFSVTSMKFFRWTIISKANYFHNCSPYYGWDDFKLWTQFLSQAISSICPLEVVLSAIFTTEPSKERVWQPSHSVPLLPCIRIGNDGTLSEGYALLPLGVGGTPALTPFCPPQRKSVQGGQEKRWEGTCESSVSLCAIL